MPISRDKQPRVGLQVVVVSDRLQLLEVHGCDFALSILLCLFLRAHERRRDLKLARQVFSVDAKLLQVLTRHLLKLIELKLSGLVVLSVIVLRGLEPKYVAVGANLVLKVLRKGTDVSDCVLLVSCGRQDTLLLNALAAWAMLVVHELGHRHELT